MLPNSTLRLEANAETPSYMIPWAPGGVSNSSATVTVVIYNDKRYFVTNAHAVN